MKIINYIQEKCKKRSKVFLSLKVIFNILTLFFALRFLFVTIPSFSEPIQSVGSVPLLLAWMTLSLGLTYLVRVICIWYSKIEPPSHLKTEPLQ